MNKATLQATQSDNSENAYLYIGQDLIEPYKANTESKEGQKFDDNKDDWFLLPLEILKPLADVMIIGEKKGYGNFSCLGHFDNSNRRFYNGQFRHTVASQLDPLAINIECDKDGNEIGRCYHLAGVAFNALMRLHHALKVG